MRRRRLVSICAVIGAWAATGAAEPADDAAPGATAVPVYAQAAVIEPAAGQGRILGFCVPAGGGLVAVTGTSERYGPAFGRPEAAEPPRHRLVWFAADGTEARAIELDFAATVTGAAPDGGIYAAGDGVVVHVSPDGAEVARGSTPHGPKTDEEREQFERSVAERHAAQVAAYDAQVERMREAVAELERKLEEAEAADVADDAEPDAEETDEDRFERRRREAAVRASRAQAQRLAAQLRQVEAAADRLRRQDVGQLVEQALRKPRQVRAVSATRDAVFVVTPEPIGFGYAVWRLDDRLENPEKIVTGLRGCCGQMDAQVFGDRLAIAVNTKHCVELRNFAGEPVAQVGHRAGAGDDPAGFGGCCNPMNTCTAPDGSLLTSESNGVVKRFDGDGNFVEVVGKAPIKPGCKNSAIAIEPDGSRLYYMDVERGTVIVLARESDAEPGAAGRDS